MSTHRYKRVKQIFFEASELEHAEVPAFLEQACKGDADLRKEVEALLGYRQTDTDFFKGIVPSTPAGVSHARFASGELVADRYRIIACLGHGGMGEVYRAEDTRLNIEIALKFLSSGDSAHPAWLASLHNEVRTARSISHPNVCRVFDLGEADGQAFLSMEYVDGGDLAALMRRIGRLPFDKGVDIARQVCAGLAAAHAHGVLHRDLKPANVMLDSHGRVRITDFGIATRYAEADTSRPVGTPAYMSPEQTEGRALDTASDIFSLGLLLHEIFGGEPAFEATKLEARLEEGHVPPHLQDVAGELPPELERVLLACLQLDPKQRPSSAVEVGMVLAGSDPLEAALVAGETPSPEMVAASRSKPTSRLLLLFASLLFLLGLATTLSLADEVNGPLMREFDKPPGVLLDHAQAFIEQREHLPLMADSAWGFSGDPFHRQSVADDFPRWAWYDSTADDTETPSVYFWYRVSPTPLAPESVENIIYDTARVSRWDPPNTPNEQAELVLDSHGNLLLYQRFASDLLSLLHHEVEPPKWESWFAEAGLEFADFESVPTDVSSPLPFDEQLAWVAPNPHDEERMIRVEAGTLGGLPIFFCVVELWFDYSSVEPSEELDGELSAESEPESELYLTAQSLAGSYYSWALLPALIALPLAWHNYKRGKSHRQGALRLAFLWFGLYLLQWLLQGTHVLEFQTEIRLFNTVLGAALLEAVLFWIVYTALEPLARRYYPRTLVSWSRGLNGALRDSLLGRDVLVGCAVGALWTAVGFALVAGEEFRFHDPGLWNTLMGPRHIVATTIGLPLDAIGNGLRLLLALTLVRATVRRPYLAIGLTLAGYGALDWFASQGSPLFLLETLKHTGIAIFLLVRFGLTAVVAANFVFFLLSTYPLTLDGEAWYLDASTHSVLVSLSLAAASLYVALGKRKTPHWSSTRVSR